MDMNEIVGLIGTTGFPIVACAVLFKLYSDTISGFKSSIEANTKAIEQNGKLIENQSDAIRKLIEKLNCEK